MLKAKDVRKALKRKRLWDLLGFNYKNGWLGYLRNNHSLNCGCAQCRYNTFRKRYERRQQRHRFKMQLRKLNEDEIL